MFERQIEKNIWIAKAIEIKNESQMSLNMCRELDFEGITDLSDHMDAAVKLFMFTGRQPGKP